MNHSVHPSWCGRQISGISPSSASQPDLCCAPRFLRRLRIHNLLFAFIIIFRVLDAHFMSALSIRPNSLISSTTSSSWSSITISGMKSIVNSTWIEDNNFCFLIIHFHLIIHSICFTILQLFEYFAVLERQMNFLAIFIFRLLVANSLALLSCPSKPISLMRTTKSNRANTVPCRPPPGTDLMVDYFAFVSNQHFSILQKSHDYPQ